jgi:hypothetical protein
MVINNLAFFVLIMSDIAEHNRRRIGDARRYMNGEIPNTKRSRSFSPRP